MTPCVLGAVILLSHSCHQHRLWFFAHVFAASKRRADGFFFCCVRIKRKGPENIMDEQSSGSNLSLQKTATDETGTLFPATTHKPGRKGDPRMHRALQARLRNPTLSLYNALCEGGFVFFPRPGIDPNSATEASLCDSEGILLCQRKNQLSRRLRSIRVKHEPGAPNAQQQHHSDDDECLDVETTSPLPQKRKASKSVDNNISDDHLFNQTRRGHGNSNHDSSRQHRHKMNEAISALFARGVEPVPSNPISDMNISESLLQGYPLLNSDTRNGSGNNIHQPLSHVNSSINMDGNRLFNHNHNHVRHVNFIPTARPKEEVRKYASTSGTEPLTGPFINECRLRSALDNYRIESGFLFKKCMVLAGFQVKQTDETNVAYLSFLDAIVNHEKQRLGKLLSVSGLSKEAGSNSSHSRSDTSAVTTSDLDSTGVRDMIEAATHSHDRNALPPNLGDLAPWATYRKPCQDSHDHDHTHNHSRLVAESANADASKCKLKGRHVHRLEGKCGHRAVIHKPDGGAPHVDFLVDGKIECYSGVKPTKADEAMWPSRFNCHDISCSKTGCHENYFHQTTTDADDCILGKEIVAPTVLDISEIDKNSNEWNIDFFNNDDTSIDSTLLGLFKLGDGTR